MNNMFYPQKVKGTRCKLIAPAYPAYDGKEIEIIGCCGSTNLVWDYFVKLVETNAELRVNDSIIKPNEPSKETYTIHVGDQSVTCWS